MCIVSDYQWMRFVWLRMKCGANTCKFDPASCLAKEYRSAKGVVGVELPFGVREKLLYPWSKMRIFVLVKLSGIVGMVD